MVSFTERYPARFRLTERRLAQPGFAPPDTQKLHEMTGFASGVVDLLRQLRDLTTPEGKRQPLPPNPAPEESRAPKRPWEEMSPEQGPNGEIVRRLFLGCCRDRSYLGGPSIMKKITRTPLSRIWR